jgi:GDP-L-fucose synthase
MEYIKYKKIWITGHKGMLGSALVRNMKDLSERIILSERREVDLTNQAEVNTFIENRKPDVIFHIAAKVGGIYANSTQPADFIRDNLLIQTNVIDGACRNGCKKLIFVASNCTYPKNVANPIKEFSILTGEMDKHTRPYGISKIAGIEMCNAYNQQYGCNYISVIPPNLYGLNDNYHPLNSHVIAGMIRKIHEAKIKCNDYVTLWGDGTPRRELLNVDDLADAMVLLMNNEEAKGVYNVGPGEDYSICEIARIVSDVIGFSGRIEYDKSKPNGVMKKLLDSNKINQLGWRAKIALSDGLNKTYLDYLSRL